MSLQELKFKDEDEDGGEINEAIMIEIVENGYILTFTEDDSKQVYLDKFALLETLRGIL